MTTDYQRGYQAAIDALRKSADACDDEIAYCQKIADDPYKAPEVARPAAARAEYFERLQAITRACADSLEARKT